MKKLLRLALAFGPVVLFCLCYVWSQDGRFYCNPERVGFSLLKGGYRAWYLSFSDGQTMDADGKWINLWRRPRLHHVDVRALLNGRRNPGSENPR